MATDTTRVTVTIPEGIVALINEIAYEGESPQSVINRLLVPTLEHEARKRDMARHDAEIQRLTLENKALVRRKLQAREGQLRQYIDEALASIGEGSLKGCLESVRTLLID